MALGRGRVLPLVQLGIFRVMKLMSLPSTSVQTQAQPFSLSPGVCVTGCPSLFTREEKEPAVSEASLGSPGGQGSPEWREQRLGGEGGEVAVV